MIKRILFGFALASATAGAQDLSSGQLTGRWAGTGTFFTRDLAERLGPLPIELEFTAEQLVSGHVGQAQARPAKVSRGRRHLQLTSSLTGRIGSVPELDKDTFVLLITAATDSTLTAEFHLKTNSVFDPRMREGRVVLRRQGD